MAKGTETGIDQIFVRLGLVAKRLQDPYAKRVKWYKIKNPDYSQALGREKIFNRRRK